MSCPSGVKQSTSWPPVLNNTKYTLVGLIKRYKSDRGSVHLVTKSVISVGSAFTTSVLKIYSHSKAGLSPHSSACNKGCGLADLDPAGRWTPGREVMYPLLIHMAGLADFTWKEQVGDILDFSGHKVSVASSLPCHGSMNQLQTIHLNGWIWLYFKKKHFIYEH